MSQEFQETAAIAMMGSASDWFRSFFLLSASSLRSCEDLCGFINNQLLRLYVSELLVKKRQSRSFHCEVVDFCRQDVVHDFVATRVGLAPLQSRIGLFVLVQSLSQMFLQNVSKGIRIRAKMLQEDTNDAPPDQQYLAKHVNNVVGWAIHSVYNRIRDSSSSMKFNGKHGVSMNEEKSLARVQQQLEFIDNMRFFDEDALQDTSYLSNCYDVELQAKNRGRLSLVAPKYFEWAKKVLTFVGRYASKDNLRAHGNGFAKSVKDALREEGGDIMECFLDSSQDYLTLSVVGKIKIHDMVVEKVMNAKLNDVIRAYNSDQLGRRAGTGHDGQQRQQLRAMSKGTLVKQSNRPQPIRKFVMLN
jgi:hypothetical protein